MTSPRTHEVAPGAEQPLVLHAARRGGAGDEDDDDGFEEEDDFEVCVGGVPVQHTQERA